MTLRRIAASFGVVAGLAVAGPGVALGATTGELEPKAGVAGCISQDGSGPCQDGVALSYVSSIVVSPDGKSAYAASRSSSDAIVIFDRNTTTGELTQKAGTAGCISDTGGGGINGGGSCVNGTAIDGPRDLVVSADGESVYMASTTSNAISVFDRNTTTGALTQKAGTAGCISEDGTDTDGTANACQDGTALLGPGSIAISPDDETVYLGTNEAVAIFDRNPTTGALTQKAGTAGCVSESGTAGACQDGRALDEVIGVSVSPDGKSVYSVANGSSAIAIFDRNTTSGALTQKAGTAGCVSDTGTGGTCQDGKALSDPFVIEFSPDGASAYVPSSDDNAVAILDRNTTTGALTQKAGTAGCVSETGDSGTCQAAGETMRDAVSVAVSPDGKSVYVAAAFSAAVTVFDRETPSGGLTPKVGAAGCISSAGTNGLCEAAHSLEDPQSITVSPDGKSVYTSSGNGSSVTVLDRENAGTTAAADLTLTQTDSLDPVALGSIWQYTITVTNNGPDAVETTQVTAKISATFSQASSTQASPGCTERGGRVVVCNLDPIASGASQDISIGFQANQNATVTSTASVRSTASDPNLANNEDAETTVLGDGGTPPITLLVDRFGTGDGTVTSQPAGITCGSDCSEDYAEGTDVTLTAVADAGSTFDGFTGSGCTTSPCTVTMDASKQVDATFTEVPVDTTPPDTSITKGPKAKSKSKKASFEFEGSDDVTPAASLVFECKLDAGAFAPCTSVTQLKKLKKGRHHFEVRATDAAGNVDATPATYDWKVEEEEEVSYEYERTS